MYVVSNVLSPLLSIYCLHVMFNIGLNKVLRFLKMLHNFMIIFIAHIFSDNFRSFSQPRYLLR